MSKLDGLEIRLTPFFVMKLQTKLADKIDLLEKLNGNDIELNSIAVSLIDEGLAVCIGDLPPPELCSGAKRKIRRTELGTKLLNWVK